MIVLTMGLPGSGKSFFAWHLSRQLNFRYIGSDHIRKEMAIMGQYGPKDKEKVYEEMKFQAEDFLRQGKDLVLDATFYKKSIRDPFISLAQQHQISLALIWVEAGEELIRERLSKKREDSEADFGIYLTLKEEFEPPQEPHLKLISESHNISYMLQKGEKYIRHLG